jgi:hypothetical protein
MWPWLVLCLAAAPPDPASGPMQLILQSRGAPLTLHVAAGVRAQGPAAARWAVRAWLSVDLAALLGPAPRVAPASPEERARRAACEALVVPLAPEDAAAGVVARAAAAARWAALGCGS